MRYPVLVLDALDLLRQHSGGMKALAAQKSEAATLLLAQIKK
jgi:hypothetical protein